MTTRLLAGAEQGRVGLAEHRAIHGRPRYVDRQQLIASCRNTRLLGRGGAAFPVAAKLAAMPESAGLQVVVNGAEGETASWKDRTLMRSVPHLVLDGVELVTAALGAAAVTIVVEDDDARGSLRAALAERPGGIAMTVLAGPGRFTGGEAGALVNHVEGRAPLPAGRGILQTVRGVGGAPTFVGNVETFAQVAVLCELGDREFASIGSPDEPGTTLVTLWGDVEMSGVVEVPSGVAVASLLGRGPGPVLVGGFHGTWLRDVDDLRLCRPALAAAGVPLGAGVIAKLPSEACALAELAAVTTTLAAASAGQCGPCTFGLPALARDVDALLHGAAAEATARRHAATVRGACAHPGIAARCVTSGLTVLAEEVAAHARGGCGRPYLGVIPVREVKS